MKRIILSISFLIITFNVFAQSGVSIDPSLNEVPVKQSTISGFISGSLVLPKKVSGKIPVVLIIGDAGAIDRDGNNPKTGLVANTYKIMANDLGMHGVASLRYDKRLVGQSESSIKESQLKIDDYSDDAVSLIKMLHDDQRFSSVVIFGHGEGSLVGMIASIDEPVKGFISAEGAGEPADKLLTEQMKSKPKFIADEFQAILDSLRKGKVTDKVDLALYNIARPSQQNFLMSWCRCVPARGIKTLKVPVLIVQGTTDLAIKPVNAEKLKKAKSDAGLLMIKDMNHILRDAPADEEKNMATYNEADIPLKPEFVTGITGFIAKIK